MHEINDLTSKTINISNSYRNIGTYVSTSIVGCKIKKYSIPYMMQIFDSLMICPEFILLVIRQLKKDAKITSL